MKNRFLNILIALDIFIFAIVSLGSGRRGETASGAAWRLLQKSKWQGKVFVPLIDWIFRPWGINHCYQSWCIDNKVELWNGSNL